MRIKPFFVILGVVFTFLGADALASISQIVFIKSKDIPPYELAQQGALDTLVRQGFVEHNSSNVHSYILDIDKDLLGQIKNIQPVLILTIGTEATKFARENIKDTAVVFSMVLDPLRQKVIEDMVRPGLNVTGAAIDVPVELQFAALHKILPGVKRVGVIYNPEESAKVIEEGRRAAAKLGLEIIAVPVQSDSAVPGAVRDLIKTIEVLWLIPDLTVVSRDSMKYIFDLTLRKKIPCLGFGKPAVEAGALLALQANYGDIGQQAALLAVEVLSGKAAGDLPVVQATHPELIVNLKTAKWLGVDIAQEIIDHAQEVIK